MLDRSVPFAFVADLAQPVLDDDARHHLERVRRLRAGDRLTVGDGAGRYRAARFAAKTELDVDGPVEGAPAPAPPITVAFALTKGDKPELAVQKLTEIGVDHIIPFVAERTVVRWDPAKAARNADRLQAVARSAAEQSHRPWLPAVGPVATFDDVARLTGAALAHPDGGPIGSEHTTLLIGPEGGWSPHEEAVVTNRVGLGPLVLRAETAALVAGALAVAVRDGRLVPAR